MKICSKCSVEKPKIEFYKDKANKDGFKSHCKSCKKTYVQKNKKIIAVNQKQWKLEHKEEERVRRKQWALNNKEERKVYNKQYHVNRKVKDPLFKLSGNLRTLLGLSIKNGGYTKSSKTEILLGANYDTVMAHFQDSWSKRYSTPLPIKYEIHHVIENNTATTEKELLKLQHYTNLIPVSYEEHKEIHNGSN